MKTRLTRLHVFLFLSVCAWVGLAQQMTPCSESFVCLNGNVAGPVDSEESCEAACRACKGFDWRCDDLESLTDTVEVATSVVVNETVPTINETEPVFVNETIPPLYLNETNNITGMVQVNFGDARFNDTNATTSVSKMSSRTGAPVPISVVLNTTTYKSVTYYSCQCYKQNDGNVCDGGGSRLDLCSDPEYFFLEKQSGATTTNLAVAAALLVLSFRR